MLIILMMGVSSGLPLALTGGTLQAWMRSEGVDLSTIGYFALVGLPYTLKFLWAPLMDRFPLSKIGRRKSWMLVTQVLLIFSILGMAFTQPRDNLQMVAILAILVSFFSASQDIVLDAWRREILPNEELGLGSSVHVAGYLFAFRMLSGALALILSEFLPWSSVYSLMAAVIGLGVLATLLCEEPQIEASLPKTFRESVLEPFVDYFSKPGAILILLFIVLYKLGDNMASQMSIPFYLDLGFSRAEVGAISKIVGWVSLTVGGLVGGTLILRLKIRRSLILFGIFQGFSNFGFAILAEIGKNLTALSAVIAVENFAIGMGTTAFVAYLASLTNKKFTATQYALLTSFMGVPRTLLVAPTGQMAMAMGWFGFFSFCTLISIPGILLIFWLHKHDSMTEI